jgi:hypothetical protein
MKRAEIDKIESYLEDKMHGQELMDFESEISRNTTLKEEIDAHRAAQEIIVDHELIAVKSKVRQFLETTKPGIKKKKRISRNTSYTGIIVVILSASLWILHKQGLEPVLDNPGRPSVVQEEPAQPDVIGEEESNMRGNDGPNADTGPSIVNTKPKEESSSGAVTEKWPFREPEPMVKDHVSTEPLAFDKKPVMRKMERTTPIASINGLSQPPDRIEITVKTMQEVARCGWERLGDEIWVEEKCFNGTVHLPSGWVEMIRRNELYVSLMPDSQELDEGAFSVEQGFFTLSARDNGGCNYSRQIIIEGNNCANESNVFSPEKGEKINFKFNADHKGRISIYSRNGLFVKGIPYASNQATAWDGYDHSNALVPLGIYFFVVVDEHGNERDRGTVYVIR